MGRLVKIGTFFSTQKSLNRILQIYILVELRASLLQTEPKSKLATIVVHKCHNGSNFFNQFTFLRSLAAKVKLFWGD